MTYLLTQSNAPTYVHVCFGVLCVRETILRNDRVYNAMDKVCLVWSLVYLAYLDQNNQEKYQQTFLLETVDIKVVLMNVSMKISQALGL